MSISIIKAPQKYQTSLNPSIWQIESDNTNVTYFHIEVRDKNTDSLIISEDEPIAPPYYVGINYHIESVLKDLVKHQLNNSDTLIVPLTKPISSYYLNVREYGLTGSSIDALSGTYSTDTKYVWNSKLDRFNYQYFYYQKFVAPTQSFFIDSVQDYTRFLTTKPDNAKVNLQSFEQLCFMHDNLNTYKVHFDFYSESGLYQSNQFTGVTSSQYVRINVSPKKLVNSFITTEVDLNSIIKYYQVYITRDGTMGTRVTEIRTYRYEKADCRLTYDNILWVNNLGGIDSYQFVQPQESRVVDRTITEKNEYKYTNGIYSDRDGDILNPKEEIINVNRDGVYKVWTKKLSDRESYWLTEFVESKQVFKELTDSSICPVSLDNSDYNIQQQKYNQAAPIQSDFTYRYKGDIIPMDLPAKVNIITGTCSAPLYITFTEITATYAVATWGSYTAPCGWEWRLYDFNNILIDTGTKSILEPKFVTLTGLTSSNLNYTFWVRSLCCELDSEPLTKSFRNLTCTPVGLSMSQPLDPFPLGTFSTRYGYLNGSGPYTIDVLLKPDWMSVGITTSNVIEVKGTPTYSTPDLLRFVVSNCGGNYSTEYFQYVSKFNGTGATGCSLWNNRANDWSMGEPTVRIFSHTSDLIIDSKNLPDMPNGTSASFAMNNWSDIYVKVYPFFGDNPDLTRDAPLLVTNGGGTTMSGGKDVSENAYVFGTMSGFNMINGMNIYINQKPLTYYNVFTSSVWQKNNCTGGQIGSNVTISVTASTFQSLVSQSDADSQAEAYMSANGQSNANSNGSCSTPLYLNTFTQSTYRKNNCGAGATGSLVVISVTASLFSSTMSQSDADNKAGLYMIANGQTYSNTLGFCTYYNVFTSSTFNRNNCGTGFGNTMSIGVTAGIFSSTASQVAANNLGVTYLSTNGQSIANSLGFCTYLNILTQQSFQKNNCLVGTGSLTLVSATAGIFSSTSSQTAANNLATTYLNTHGQTTANGSGFCTNFEIKNTVGGTIDNVSETFYSLINGSFPVHNGDTAYGIVTDYVGSITVTLSGAVGFSRLVLIVSGFESTCISVAGPGTYGLIGSFTSADYVQLVLDNNFCFG